MFVKEITKRYDGKAVVDGVSFEIPKGKVLSLIGPNGAGKSTVMGMLSRLIARDSGIVDFEGTEITRWKSRELSKRLAILTQANNVQMKLTVRELVAFGRFPYSGGRLTQEDNEIIDRAIAYMELGDFEEQFIDELSGGQRQRAYIAMVIAQDTEYILLDEPTNNLDIYHATNLMRIVRRLCDELGKTVILVLHEINYAAFYSDYICAFVDGKIAKFGTVQEVITKENLSDIYKVDFEIITSLRPPQTSCRSSAGLPGYWCRCAAPENPSWCCTGCTQREEKSPKAGRFPPPGKQEVRAWLLWSGQKILWQGICPKFRQKSLEISDRKFAWSRMLLTPPL